MIRAPENPKELIEFLREFAVLEWAKPSTRYVTYTVQGKQVTEDRSSSPPFCSFRFAAGADHVIAAIVDAVGSYAGVVKWIVRKHDRSPLSGVNCVIMPAFMAEAESDASRMNKPAIDYCKENFPHLGAMANDDFPALAAHIFSKLSRLCAAK